MRVLVALTSPAESITIQKALHDDLRACVETVHAGEEAFELLRLYDYDIVVLDETMPDTTGVAILSRLRRSNLNTPALILCSSLRAEAKLSVFRAGADDVLAKPYFVEELLARLKAIVRRTRGFSQPVLTLGALKLNLDGRDVSYADIPVKLTGKEYAVLELLMLRRNTAVTKEALLGHLYGGMDEPEPKIIDVFICKVRGKLAKAGGDNVIGTVWGQGYIVRERVEAASFEPPRSVPPELLPLGRPVAPKPQPQPGIR